MKTKRPCLRCGKEYLRLDHHFNNKNKCKVLYLDISYDDMIQNYKEYKIIYDKLLNNGKFKCDNCNKVYKYKRSLTCHQKTCSDNITMNMASNSNKNGNINFNFNSCPININITPVFTKMGHFYNFFYEYFFICPTACINKYLK